MYHQDQRQICSDQLINTRLLLRNWFTLLALVCTQGTRYTVMFDWINTGRQEFEGLQPTAVATSCTLSTPIAPSYTLSVKYSPWRRHIGLASRRISSPSLAASRRSADMRHSHWWWRAPSASKMRLIMSSKSSLSFLFSFPFPKNLQGSDRLCEKSSDRLIKIWISPYLWLGKQSFSYLLFVVMRVMLLAVTPCLMLTGFPCLESAMVSLTRLNLICSDWYIKVQ